VGDDVPSKLIQESNGLTGDVGASVVVEKACALGQHSSSPVLNRPSEFFECLTIPVSVYCGPMSHEVDQFIAQLDPFMHQIFLCLNFARYLQYNLNRHNEVRELLGSSEGLTHISQQVQWKSQ